MTPTERLLRLLTDTLESWKYIWRFTIETRSLKRVSFKISKALYQGTNEFFSSIRDGNVSYLNGQIRDIYDITFSNQRTRCAGLHKDLQEKMPFGFSILMPVFQPNSDFFYESLKSCVLQTAPKMELIIGYDGPQPKDVYAQVERLRSEYPHLVERIIEVEVDRKNGGGISLTTNEIAKLAKYDFFLLVDHDDWIRPDLLYRYHQTLMTQKSPTNTVLYCDEGKIDEKGIFIPGTFLRKPEVPDFPFIFINYICHCLLVPRQSWELVNGLIPDRDGAQDFDLCLRLDLAGLKFRNVAIVLYAWRAHQQSTAKSTSSKIYTHAAGESAMRDYFKLKQIEVEVSEGIVSNTYRIIPQLRETPEIQVFVPFRDQKKLTLECAESLSRQKGVKIYATFVNNQSVDPSIEQRLLEMGYEVLEYNSHFNFSEMNNHAVRSSKFHSSPYLFFLNNDVSLETDAALEMARWASMEQVGAVGCKLMFADRKIQHGGVHIPRQSLKVDRGWEHIEIHYPENMASLSNIIKTCDAVTGAALMMRRELFKKMNGFDSIFYPIAYSDTDLCTRIRKQGFSILYTPYARGTHHESVSRGKKYLEDYEASIYLENILDRRSDGHTFYEFH